jgi:hypothetical protein
MIRKQLGEGVEGREEGEGKGGDEREILSLVREKREGEGKERERERNLNFYLKSESSCTPGVVAMTTAKKRR